jgi:Rrf2 family protein
MLKLSTKGRYGVRLMVDLAQHYGKGPVVLKDVGRRQDISVKYLEHLIVPLKKAKLIRATRGARGGYVLFSPPGSITLRDIISAVEGGVCLVECTKSPAACRRSGICLSRSAWNDISNKISETLESFTLEQILSRGTKNEEIITYSI